MKVTPLEIRQQQFPLRFRGCDPTQVDVFLELVATTVDELLRENTWLREGLAKRDQEIQGIRAQEKDWKQVLLAVQQTRDDLITRGQQEAHRLVAEAQRKVHQLLSDAEKTHQTMAQDVQLLVCQKRQLMSGLQNLLSQHLALLQVQEGQDERRYSSDTPDRVATTVVVPQTAGDKEQMAAFNHDLAHTGAEDKARMRQAAHLVEEYQRCSVLLG
jgi:cell division initiation protein